jgi:hypothetical protein
MKEIKDLERAALGFERPLLGFFGGGLFIRHYYGSIKALLRLC